jgi:hypothetical protein
MNFRQRLFLMFVMVTLTLASVEIITDSIEQRRGVRLEAERALDELEHLADVAVRFDGVRPFENTNESIPFNSRIRVLEGQQVLLTLDQTQPGAMLVTREKAVTSSQRFELAVDIRSYRAVLINSFQRDLTYDLIGIVLALGVAWWLSGIALKPLEKLSQAMSQPAPQPLPVMGKDVLAKLASGFNDLTQQMHYHLDRERALMRYTAQEINIPLQSMAYSVESLLMGVDTNDVLVPMLQRDLERIQQVTRTLPSFAHGTRQSQTASLIGLLKDTIRLLPDRFQDHIAFKVSMASNPKVTQPMLVSQCILSLLDNALQSKGEVRLTLEPYEGLARVRIEHYGFGLPEKDIEQLRQPLYSLPASADDTLVRLAFVQHVISNLEGTLEVRNTARGLEAVMTLPVAEVSPRLTQVDTIQQPKENKTLVKSSD